MYSRAARRHTHRRVECGECGSVPEQALILPSGADQLHAQRQPRPAAPAWETSTTYKTRWPLASGRSGGLSQRQIVLQAAPSSGQPRPTRRLGPRWPVISAGSPHIHMHIHITYADAYMHFHAYANAYAYLCGRICLYPHSAAPPYRYCDAGQPRDHGHVRPEVVGTVVARLYSSR